jgi:hypothetical protein
MKRVRNLIENKGLINTFNKFKNKNHTFKSTLKKKYYFFSKFHYKPVLRTYTFFIKVKFFKKNYIGGFEVARLSTNSYSFNNLFSKILLF